MLMARFRRLEVLQQMLDYGLVPVFYNADFDVAKKIVRACVAGGARVVEFTNRGDLAYQVFSELVRWAETELPETILGVGSVVDGPTCALYVASGANFVVGPVLSPEAARVANRRKVAYIPGCGSATEISQAEELGAEIVKIFPGGQVGGPAFVKAILGPCPWSLIMPTGGVDPTEESLGAWFGAGAACVGMGSKLVRKDLVKAGDYGGIEKAVRDALATIQKVRAARP
jgi:2-dehydro-3-deoxyphosphogluconate aldolase/(4S)-4-hydroxy-2-oxoglutarate aldolase